MDGYYLIEVHPEAIDITWPIQEAISTGHLWVRTLGRAPITYLIFSKNISIKDLTNEQLSELVNRILEEEIVRNGS